LQEKGLVVRTSSGVLVENIGALFTKSANAALTDA
jgi:hypothetical protein